MKREQAILCLVMALFAFNGCDSVIKTPDGTIPQSFISAAVQYEGTYTGSMSGGQALVLTGTNVPIYTTGTFSLALEGNKPVLSFLRADNQGSDVILPDCDSSIGQLQNLIVDKNTLKTLSFTFNPNRCSNVVSGTELNLNVHTNSDGALELNPAIFLYNTGAAGCFPDPGSVVSTCEQGTDEYWTGSLIHN